MVDPVRFPDIEYPETDGKPMPDGDYQGVFYRYAVQAVRDHFLPRSEVYVTGNLFIYLEEGNPKNRIAPDMYVVMNGGHRFRDTYKVWEEPGGIPDFVLEIVSPSTWCTDLGPKRDQYAALGVGEYWLHDPHANFMHPALAGYRLSGDAYEPISGIESPEGTLTMHSETLGLDLCLQGEKLRFFDPVRGEYLLDYAETLAKMHVAEHEAHAAQAALHAAKSEAHAARAETHAAESEAHAARAAIHAARAKVLAAQDHIDEPKSAFAESKGS